MMILKFAYGRPTASGQIHRIDDDTRLRQDAADHGQVNLGHWPESEQDQLELNAPQHFFEANLCPIEHGNAARLMPQYA